MNEECQPEVSILIPTLNEAGNIDPLLSRILSVIETARLQAEVLIVDGGSTDGTQAQVQKWIVDPRVRLILSDAKRGLAGDIIVAADSARGDFVVVLDADLSHPPEAMPEMLRPLLNGTHDMALGSRYVRGGALLDWPWTRWFTSRVATMLVKPLVSVKDPLSGFFAVKRELLLKLARHMAGFKIALEVLARGNDTLRVLELPIVFQNRASGKSKFGVRQIVVFLMQLVALSGGVVPVGLNRRLACFGLMGLLLDLLLFNIFVASQMNLFLCQIGSFFAATVLNYGLVSRRNFTEFARSNGILVWQLSWRVALIFIHVLVLRSAVFLLIIESWGLPQRTAILVAAMFAAALFVIGTTLCVVLKPHPSDAFIARWQMISLVIVAYILLLKMVFMGLINVMPEEAYYWNYAQHLDFGYLDHPPMVAWLIWLSTGIFGNSEFSVRLTAFITWIIAAIFMFRLSANLCDRRAGFRSVLLLAVLPIYFGAGFFITPDAPLYAAWAGCLYFLERALIAEKRHAWWGVGVCVGLGLLAKYTIALLGLATLTFLLLNRQSRRWLLRPQPYVAALVSAMLFSPVLLWNFRNDWASFMFQGLSRWSGSPEFSLHYLLFSVVLVLSPVGMLSAVKILLPERVAETSAASNFDRRRIQRLWWLNFTLVPLSVFFLHSLQNDVKLHWTGPVFLAAIPLLAADMVPRIDEVTGSLTRIVRGAWLPMIITLIIVYGGMFNYFSLGSPGSPMMATRAFGAWRLLAERVGQIEKVLADETGSEPVIVGMDKYMISSQISFYDFNDGDGVKNTGGPHFFGGRSLMWEIWLPRSHAVGRNFLMIDFDRKRLDHPSLSQYFSSTGEVFNETLERDGRMVGSFYWRVGYGYRNP
jgi:dolichol-phosphate mannosyltransferase